MTCDHCGEVLVRCVVQWEDGSASVVWRCGCEVTDDDQHDLHGEAAEAAITIGPTLSELHDAALETRGWA